jgi:uncharacterized protein YndB with AHSA1/START domain
MPVEPIAPYLEPLRVSVRVERPQAEAFELFTDGIARWWPLATHSIAQERAGSCVIEPHAGGAVYEIGADGARHPWGRVVAWEPPRRLVMSWHPGRPPEQGQELEVRFEPEGAATRVELEHRDWQKLGAQAERGRESYGRGWASVLQSYVEASR